MYSIESAGGDLTEKKGCFRLSSVVPARLPDLTKKKSIDCSLVSF